MTQIIEREWKGLLIGQQKRNGFINATQLAKAYWQATGIQKKPSHWQENKRTQESIAYLANVTGIPSTDLVVVIQGGDPSEQGTWIHPDLGVNFAVWLSVELEFIVFGWVKDWLKDEQPQPKAIAPEVEVAREVAEIYTSLSDYNPRIAQLLVDSRVNRFMGQAALPGTTEVWKGAVEIAEDLGYQTNHRNRGKLGKHVKTIVGHLGKEEKRLCNGTNRPIWLYPDNQEVRDAVESFFEEGQQAS